MSKNRVLLSVFTVVAVACMASESATAQLLQGRLIGRRAANACCTPAPVVVPAPTCCEAPQPQRVRILQQVRARVAAPANNCGCETPAPVSSCGCTAAVPAPAPATSCCGTTAVPAVAPVPATSCCGGTVSAAPVVSGTVMSEGVYYGDTVVESDVQASPSDAVVTEPATVTNGTVIEPPAAADAPAEDN